MKGRTVYRHHFFQTLSQAWLTSESTGFSQQEGAPGHEEEERRLKQRETVQLGEFGNVAVELRLQQPVFGVFIFNSPVHATP